jgi:carboxyl-terminal processing protease
VVNPIIGHETRISSLPEAGLSGLFGLGSAPQQGDGGSPADTFQDVYRYIKSEYVDHLDDDKKLSYGAVKTMLLSMDDPKTRFLDPAQLKKTREQMDGKFTGIGATVAVVKQKKGVIDQRRLAVVAPVPGGPADKAGVRAGDMITHVDGKWVIAYDPRQDLDKIHAKDMDDAQIRKAMLGAIKRLQDGISLPKALDLISAPDGKNLELTLERQGSTDPVKVKIVTASVSVEPAEFKVVNDKVGYLRITQFSDRSVAIIQSAITSTPKRSLIIDLRDNSGGPITVNKPLPTSAAALLTRLCGGGDVGNVVRKGGPEPIRLDKSSAPKIKVAVLINHGTANVAEVVASALKEKGGATLIGAHTFGDSIMQRLVTLRDGAAMTLSAGKYLTASGQEFTGKGIQPDVAVATGGPQMSDDAAYKRAVTALTGA